ncbi:hypothetical protein EVC62_06620 [Salinicola endophyticus]|uniref:LysR family transcriptional regulator n=1 Tax=Salinicola endophyticus TaxID=1949083 RepID=A0ABY8FGL4_9GAMM|nr:MULTISPECIES: hypothetical protein [Salinicola]WFF41200.1 hypothetical protein EVC62_06620 [Salinicola endophyticus]
MHAPAPIPEDYTEWRHCITVACGIALTPRYIATRLQALNDPRDYHTQRLLAHYGQDHHRRLIAWFERAARESTRQGA